MSKTFAELGLKPELLDTLATRGYTAPTAIQAALIPHMIEGRDVVGQAQTGTGKTAAFALPMLSGLTPSGNVQGLVVAPTRELALQVSDAVYQYGHALGARVLPVFGGQPYHKQIKRLERGVDVVVGTPGRLLDLVKRGSLDLSQLKTLVLDEADEMLSMGFVEDIEAILQATPATRQTALLSATMPAPIRRLAERYLNDPQTCTIAATETTLDVAEQYALVREKDKTGALLRLLEMEDVASAIVFARTRVQTVEIAEALAQADVAAVALNGEMNQAQRNQVLDGFRAQRFQVLVATDVAARGLDVDHVSHVFNAALPREAEVYVHRIGRTGRAGRSGRAWSLVAPHEQGLLRRVENVTRRRIELKAIPTVAAIRARRDERLADSLKAALEVETRESIQTLVANMAETGIDPITLAEAAIMLAGEKTVARPIPYVAENVEDRRQGGKKKAHRGYEARSHHGEDRSAHEAGMVRLVMATGKKNGTQPRHVVSALARFGNFPGAAIGKILIGDRETLVDLPGPLAGKILDRKGGCRMGKKMVDITKA